MYKKIKELQNQNDLIFRLALDQLLALGIEHALEITDEDIQNVTIPLFDDAMARLLYTMIRELARYEKEDFRCLFKFIQTERLYDIKGFKKGENK